MGLKSLFKNINQNLKVKCEFCRTSVKKKSAYVEDVKLLEFVYPKKTYFCDENCCLNYKTYEKSVPKRVSLCSSCPTHPDAGPKINKS